MPTNHTKNNKPGSLSSFKRVMEDRPAFVLNDLNLRLFVAITLGIKEDVEQVIAEGADVNALNLNQVSPLALAKAFKRTEVVKMLEAQGARRLRGK